MNIVFLMFAFKATEMKFDNKTQFNSIHCLRCFNFECLDSINRGDIDVWEQDCHGQGLCRELCLHLVQPLTMQGEHMEGLLVQHNNIAMDHRYILGLAWGIILQTSSALLDWCIYWLG